MLKTTEKYQSPGAKAWTYVFLLCLVGCLNYLDRIMITTMRPAIKLAIPMTEADFGLLTAVFLWVYGLCSPLAGYLSDRFKRSSVIIASLFLWSAVTWLTAHATTFGELVTTRALMGISEACYIPAALALIMDYHKGATRSFATGLHMAGILAGQSLGSIGGYLSEHHEWNYPFKIFGVAGMAYALILAISLRDAPDRAGAGRREDIHLPRAMHTLFREPSFILVLICWTLIGICGWIVLGWLPSYYMETFNLSQGRSGVYSTTYISLAGLAGVVLGGFLADRWQRVNPTARVLVPAIGAFLAATGVLLGSNSMVLIVTIACFVLYALTKAFSDANMMPVLCMIVDTRYIATGYGILNFFACLAGGLGLYAGGLLRDAAINIRNIFLVAGVLLLVCGFLLIAVIKRMRRTAV